jgi:hypothetical protein
MLTYEQVRDGLIEDPEVVKLINIDDALLPLLSKTSRAMILLLRDLAAEKKDSLGVKWK